ncbi:MAG: hypothetical protein AAFO02_12355, partial [Bacteroidota bacterium]
HSTCSINHISGASTTDMIYRTGRVGLGTTTPVANLHISETSRGGIGSGGLETTGGGDGTGAGAYQIRLDKNYDEASYYWGIDGGNNLDFLRDNGSGFQNLMSLNGNRLRVFGEQVSIGGGSKQFNLGSGTTGQFMAMGYRPIGGTIYQGFGAGGAVIYSDGSGGLGLVTKASGTINTSTEAQVLVNAAGQMGVGTMAPSQQLHLMVQDGPVAVRLDAGDINWDLQADSDQKFRLRRNDESMFSVNRNGQVAIGTEETPITLDGGETDISAYRLFVEGGILTKEVRVRELWADYVFEADYDLLSLTQVEEFIDENGHLPNTPSAEQVEAQGLDLGAATVNQQEKIEELYLHLITLNKRLEKLEAENAKLKAAQD